MLQPNDADPKIHVSSHLVTPIHLSRSAHLLHLQARGVIRMRTHFADVASQTSDIWNWLRFFENCRELSDGWLILQLLFLPKSWKWKMAEGPIFHFHDYGGKGSRQRTLCSLICHPDDVTVGSRKSKRNNEGSFDIWLAYVYIYIYI